jgi:hypothetical protein
MATFHPLRTFRFRPIADIGSVAQVAAMLVSILMGAALAIGAAGTVSCPRQPEPTPLTSTAFQVPSSGEALLFSATPSFQSIRYALRVIRPAGTRVASATLIRLKRRWDCNVHDRAGQWHFRLSAVETDRLFAAVKELERHGDNPSEIVMDGTSVELQRFSSGDKAYQYSSNGPPKEQLSRTVLMVLKQHVPRTELPATDDWRFRMPGTSL